MVDLSLIESNTADTLRLISTYKKVYEQEPKNLLQLPAASLFFDGFKSDDEASRRKKIAWRWILRIYVKLHDPEDAQTELKQLIVNSLKELMKNPTLGGSCLYHTVKNGEVFVVTDQNNPQLMAELHLEATTQENY